MSDPAIKLFGKTIPLPELGVGPCSRVLSQHQDQIPLRLSDSSTGDDEELGESGLAAAAGGEGGDDGGGVSRGGGENTSEKKETQEELVEESLRHESSEVDTTSGVTEKTETPKGTKTNEDSSQSETCGSTETKLKKPDKILPCPRCNSMETKFCYYNNYNVNQPRHFCKKCQRYWTAGGTMRNVPVGAGRRKNKNPASSHYNRHVSITSAEAIQKAARTDLNGANLLTFGSDSVLCESMAAGLNLADKSLLKKTQEPNEGLKIAVPLNPSNDEGRTISPLPKVPCFPGPPPPPPAWPYAWNGVSWTVLPFYPPPPPPPAAYWSCPGVSPGGWNGYTWMPQQPNSPNGSGPNSPLGKHSRDETEPGAALEETESKSKPERCLWVPKTLRIDDPEEAAKSSIWETLGIKKDEKEETFGAFRSSSKEKSNLSEGRRPELQANPAALSRSTNFHESS